MCSSFQYKFAQNNVKVVPLMDNEKIAVSEFSLLVSKTNRLQSIITDGERESHWDGYVHVFSGSEKKAAQSVLPPYNFRFVWNILRLSLFFSPETHNDSTGCNHVPDRSIL